MQNLQCGAICGGNSERMDAPGGMLLDRTQVDATPTVVGSNSTPEHRCLH
jgi:hypothetical protein